MEIIETLKARQSTHGNFEDGAVISQTISQALRSGISWHKMAASQQEALEMIAHKMSRIVNGDPLFIDSVRDIIGYAKLMQDILERTEGATDVTNTRKRYSDGSWQETA